MTLSALDSKLFSSVSEVFQVLKGKGYAKIEDVPLRKYPVSKHLLAYSAQCPPADGPSLFSVSADPAEIRKKVLNSDSLMKMYELFFLNASASSADFVSILGEGLFGNLVSCGLLHKLENGNGFRSILRYVPDNGKTFVTSAWNREAEHFTYLSYDSMVFARHVSANWRPEKSTCRMLDYCCGTGYVGLSVKRESDSLVGVDKNFHAVWMAELNATLLGAKNTSFIVADSPPETGQFDLIMCNPPFVMLPPAESGKLDSYGGEEFGLQLTLKFIPLLHDKLGSGGEAYMITRSPIVQGEDYLLKKLDEKYSHIIGVYKDVSPSLEAPNDWEKSMGVECFNHIFLSFKAGRGGYGNPAGWKRIAAEGAERFRYAF